MAVQKCQCSLCPSNKWHALRDYSDSSMQYFSSSGLAYHCGYKTTTMLCSSKATDKLQCKLTAVIKRQPWSVAVIPKHSHFFHTCNRCSVARDMSSESRQCDMSSERYSLRIVTGCHIQIRRVIRGTGGNGSSRTACYSFRVKHSLELSCRPGLDILSFLDVGCLEIGV